MHVTSVGSQEDAAIKPAWSAAADAVRTRLAELPELDATVRRCDVCRASVCNGAVCQIRRLKDALRSADAARASSLKTAGLDRDRAEQVEALCPCCHCLS